MIGFGILLVLIESCLSRETRCLGEMYNTNRATYYLQNLLGVRPKIYVNTVSYHYETRTRTRRDRDGRHRTETYQERVDTHTDQCEFEYGSCKDTSDMWKMPAFDGKGIIFVKLGMHISLAGSNTVEALENKKSEMIEKNKHLDQCIECSVEEHVDFEKYFTVIDDEEGIPCWMDNSCYAVAALCCCSWPYRFCLKRKAKRKQFRYYKEISMEGQSILNSVCEGQSILNVPSAPLFGYETHASDFEVRVPLTAMSGSSACNVEEPPPSYESLRIDEKHTSGNSPKSRMTPMRLPTTQ